MSSVPFETDSAGPGWRCVFSPDARLVLVALPGTNVLQLWDVWRKVVVASLTGHSQTITCCRFSPDGRRVLSGAAGGELKLWDPATGKEVLALNGHTARVYACEFSPDGLLAVSRSLDQTLKLWCVESGVLWAEYWVSGDGPVSWTPDGKALLLGDELGQLLRLEPQSMPSGPSWSQRFGSTGMTRPTGVPVWRRHAGPAASASKCRSRPWMRSPPSPGRPDSPQCKPRA